MCWTVLGVATSNIICAGEKATSAKCVCVLCWCLMLVLCAGDSASAVASMQTSESNPKMNGYGLSPTIQAATSMHSNTMCVGAYSPKHNPISVLIYELTLYSVNPDFSSLSFTADRLWLTIIVWYRLEWDFTTYDQYLVSVGRGKQRIIEYFELCRIGNIAIKPIAKLIAQQSITMLVNLI